MHLRALFLTTLIGLAPRLAPRLALAQARRPSVANVRLLIIPAWTSPDSALDSLVSAATFRLRQRADSRDITVLSWLVLQRDFPIAVPPFPTLSDGDLNELGKQFAADVVLAVRRKPGSTFVVRPIVVRGSSSTVVWPPLRARTLAALADTLVARIAGDSTLRRWRREAAECPEIGDGLTNVDRAAAFIDDTRTDLRPARLGVSGTSVVRFVVDPLGRVDPPTLVLVRASGAVTLEEIAAAARDWRFRPALRGRCPVRQRLEIQLTR